jgi:hypothetical protein
MNGDFTELLSWKLWLTGFFILEEPDVIDEHFRPFAIASDFMNMTLVRRGITVEQKQGIIGSLITLNSPHGAFDVAPFDNANFFIADQQIGRTAALLPQGSDGELRLDTEVICNSVDCIYVAIH